MSDDLLHIAYWSDPLCIWAYVAQQRLDRLLQRFGHHVALDYHVVPVFGSVPQRFRDGSWAKAGPQGRADVTARVAREHGHPEVTGQVWLDSPPSGSWSPGAALKAVWQLEAEGLCEQGAGAAYQWAMRRSFFAKNMDISQRAVQLRVAESQGLDAGELTRRLDDGSALAALWEDHEHRRRKGVQGSPTYVFDGGRVMLYGNFNEDVLQATVQELLKGVGAGGSPCP